MSVKLLTEHYLEFLSLKGGCTGLSESTLVKYHIVGNHMSRLICLLRHCYLCYTCTREKPCGNNAEENDNGS